MPPTSAAIAVSTSSIEAVLQKLILSAGNYAPPARAEIVPDSVESLDQLENATIVFARRFG
jgi:hypothetical protein